jgi:HK97 family phage portal protein
VGFFYNLFNNAKPKQTKAQNSTPLTLPFLGSSVNWLSDNSQGYITSGYAGNPIVYSIVKQITDRISSVPFYLYQVQDDKKLKRYKALNLSNNLISTDAIITKSQSLKEVESHKINDLLEQPNELQSWSEFVKAAMGYKLITGNAYLYGAAPDLGQNKGKVISMSVLPSQLMNIVSKNSAEVDFYNIIGSNTRIEKDNILHLKYWNPDFSSGLQHYGQSPLRAALKVMQLNDTAYNTQASILQNKGAYGILSDESQSLDEDQMKQLKERFTNASANEILIASASLKFEQIGMPTEDLMLIESMGMNLRDLCNIYSFPSLLLGDNAQKTYSNFEQAEKSVIYNIVVPELTGLRDSLNKWILPQYEKSDGKKYFIDFDIQVLPQLAVDLEKLVAQLEKQYWLTPNEKRAAVKYGTLPDPAMDKIYMPSGLTPIDELSISIDTTNQDLSDYQ